MVYLDVIDRELMEWFCFVLLRFGLEMFDNMVCIESIVVIGVVGVCLLMLVNNFFSFVDIVWVFEDVEVLG